MADARRSGMVAAATVLSIAVGVMAVITVATLESSLSDLRGDPALAGAPGRYVWESSGAFGSQEALDLAMSRPDVTSVTEQLQLDEQELAVGVDGVALAADGLSIPPRERSSGRDRRPAPVEPRRGGPR